MRRGLARPAARLSSAATSGSRFVFPCSCSTAPCFCQEPNTAGALRSRLIRLLRARTAEHLRPALGIWASLVRSSAIAAIALCLAVRDMRPGRRDVRPGNRDAPAISQRNGVGGCPLARRKGNVVSYTLLQKRRSQKQRLQHNSASRAPLSSGKIRSIPETLGHFFRLNRVFTTTTLLHYSSSSSQLSRSESSEYKSSSTGFFLEAGCFFGKLPPLPRANALWA